MGPTAKNRMIRLSQDVFIFIESKQPRLEAKMRMMTIATADQWATGLRPRNNFK